MITSGARYVMISSRLSSRSFVFRFGNLTALGIIFLVGAGSDISQAQIPDSQVSKSENAIYARAVEFCRGTVKRPMVLDLDKRVLCFDGHILPELDVSLVNSLTDGGLFVVRSFGGSLIVATKLADLLRERQAIVIVYDYCFSACAEYLLIASSTAFVLKNTLVAWHHAVSEYGCPLLVEAKDGGPKRLAKSTCPRCPAKISRRI